MDYQEYMEKMQLNSFKRILTAIETFKEAAPELYQDLSYDIDGYDEELNAEQMVEYCKKRIKELEETQND